MGTIEAARAKLDELLAREGRLFTCIGPVSPTLLVDVKVVREEDVRAAADALALAVLDEAADACYSCRGNGVQREGDSHSWCEGHWQLRDRLQGAGE